MFTGRLSLECVHFSVSLRGKTSYLLSARVPQPLHHEDPSYPLRHQALLNLMERALCPHVGWCGQSRLDGHMRANRPPQDGAAQDKVKPPLNSKSCPLETALALRKSLAH